MSRPTLQQLNYLVALHEHRHFGRAAEATFVSQPALSAQIQELEKRLGTSLVERTARGLLFTPAGEEIARRAMGILTNVDELTQLGGDATMLTGVVRIGVIPTMAPYLLPHVVQVFAQHNEASLSLHEQRTDDVLVALRAGKLDLALLAGPIDGNDLRAQELADDPFVLAMSTRRHVGAKRALLRLDDLLAERVLLLEDGHCLRDQALAVCSLAHIPTVDVASTSLATLTQMVAADLGVTLLPASTLAVEARPGSGITIRRFQSPAPKRTIVLAWRKSSPRNSHFAAIADAMRPRMLAATTMARTRATDLATTRANAPRAQK